MSREFSEVDIRRISIPEDLTDDEGDDNNTNTYGSSTGVSTNEADSRLSLLASSHYDADDDDDDDDELLQGLSFRRKKGRAQPPSRAQPSSSLTPSTSPSGTSHSKPPPPPAPHTNFPVHVHTHGHGHAHSNSLIPKPVLQKDKTAGTVGTMASQSTSYKSRQRKRRIAKIGQRAASLKFSPTDVVAMSPDRLKKHYKIGKLLQSTASGNTPRRQRLGSSVRSQSQQQFMAASGHSSRNAFNSSFNSTTNHTQQSGNFYNNVHLCLHRETGVQRAVKVVPKSKWHFWQNELVVQQFKIMSSLDHPNLIRAYELFEGKDHYYIILDALGGNGSSGSLCDELDQWGALPEEDAALILHHLLGVLHYCHTNRIVHGNVKPEHILLEQDKDLDHIKLTDFSCAEIYMDDEDEEEENDDGRRISKRQSNPSLLGTSSHSRNNNHKGSISKSATLSVEDDEEEEESEDSNCGHEVSEVGITTVDSLTGERLGDALDESITSDLEEEEEDLDNSRNRRNIMPERKGTPDFWAPEVVLKGSTGPKRDVWACGVLCYLILSNRFPFKGSTREEVCERIIRGEFSFGERRHSSFNGLDEYMGLDDYDDDDFDSFYADYLDGEADPLDSAFSWNDISESAKSFIRYLLTYDEKGRPTAREALRHPWILQMTQRRKLDYQQQQQYSYTGSATHGNEFVNSMATMAAWNNVAKYNATNKLKQATLTLIAAQMVLKEERKAIDHVFRTLDIYNDGRLSRKEVRKGYRECFNRDLTDAEVEDLFRRVDLNRTGYIEYSEFVVAAMNEHDLLHRQKIRQAFSLFDQDGTGTISKEDLKEVLTYFKGGGHTELEDDPIQVVIDDDAIDRIVKQADRTGEGKISYEEFMAMMLMTTDASTDSEDESEMQKEDRQPNKPPKDPFLQHLPHISIDTTGTGSGPSITMVKFTTDDFVAHRPRELSDEYTIEDFIDEGGFGKVYVCKHKATEAERALKVIDRSRWRKERNTKILNEFELLKEMDHPNIIKFYDLFQDRQHFYIVMDICKGGDLCDELDTWGRLSEDRASVLTKQVLACLNYCHKKKIIHRDMKPDNILLEQNKDLRHVKIIDFGFATRFEDGVEMTKRVGTTEYMAPEVVKRSYYGAKCDIWSVGVICYLVLTDKFPFREKNKEVLYEAIVNQAVNYPSHSWESVSQEAIDFVKMLLTKDPDQRPTAEQALTHPWIKTAQQSKARPPTTASDSTPGLVEPSESTEAGTTEGSAAAISALSNLKGFNPSKLKQAVQTLIASQLLLKEEKQAIDEVFRDLDISSNGRLSKSEVKAAFFKFFGYNLSNEEIDDLFRRVDHGGSGYIEYGEFVVAAMNEKVLLGQNKLRKAFDLFDSDGNGLISASDLTKALSLYANNGPSSSSSASKGGSNKREDDAVVDRLIQQVDADGDGMISFEEFVGLMMVSTGEDIAVR